LKVKDVISLVLYTTSNDGNDNVISKGD
jgi:hypothetical protein